MEISDWLLLNNNWLLVTEPSPKHCTRRWAWELNHSPTRKGRGHRILSLCITCHDEQSKGVIECPKVSLACRQIVEIIASPSNSPYGLCKKHTSFLYVSVALWFENSSDIFLFLFLSRRFSQLTQFMFICVHKYLYIAIKTLLKRKEAHIWVLQTKRSG